VQGVESDRLREVLLQRMNRAEPGLFDTVEATLVKTAFEFCHGNQVQTAHLLGLSRNVLRTLLKRHGLLDRPAHADDVAEDRTASLSPLSQ
jgi:sigma-54-specific transcriptional regulator